VKKLLLALLCGCCICLGGTDDGGAPAPAPAPTPLYDATLSSALADELPPWLKFSGEFRTRVEERTAFSFIPGNNNTYGLFRTRLNVDITPSYWFEVFAQMQDSHEVGQMAGIAPKIYQDPADLRQAYLKLKTKSGLMKVTVGRQLLAYGSQRLIGPLDWTNVARSWDAAKLELGTENAKLDLFASSVVVNNPADAIDHSRTGNNIHGAYGSLKKIVPFTSFEPYLFWKVGHESLYTGGVRFLKAPGTPGLGRVDYELEGADQWGTVGVKTARAYALSSIVGETLTAGGWMPRVSTEYDEATGNRNPSDPTRLSTFDQLLGTNHGLYGITDQVGWKNMRQYRLGADAKATKTLRLAVDYRMLWLMTPKDDLYDATGALSVKPKAGNTATKIGNEIDVSGNWQFAKQWRLSGGIGHLTAGQFLTQNSKGSNMTFPYGALQWTF